MWYLFVIFLAFIVTEGTVEYLLGVPMDKIEKLKPYKWVLMYPSMALGIFVCSYYKVDVVYLLAAQLGIAGVAIGPVGISFTGILIGRGANFVNDMWQKYFPEAGARNEP